MSIDDVVVPFEMLTVDDTCEMTEDEEISETDKEDGEFNIVSEVVKGLRIFRHLLKVLKMCLKKFLKA